MITWPGIITLFVNEVIVMNQLNSIILEGNLVKDAELLEPVNGFKVCKFSIGVNRFYKNKKDEGVNEVSYFEIETYGKSAEYCDSKAKKGRGVRVVGRLKQETWTDEDKKFHSKVYVIAEHVEFKPVFAKEADKASEADDFSSMKEHVPVEETVPVAETTSVPVEEAVF